jgi:hypothetical protein
MEPSTKKNTTKKWLADGVRPKGNKKEKNDLSLTTAAS